MALGEAPCPASGLAMRMEAKPHLAIAHEGSLSATSRKVFSAAEYQNECSIATPRSNWACTLGSQELGKFTLPSCSAPCAGMAAASAVMDTNVESKDFMMASADDA